MLSGPVAYVRGEPGVRRAAYVLRYDEGFPDAVGSRHYDNASRRPCYVAFGFGFWDFVLCFRGSSRD